MRKKSHAKIIHKTCYLTSNKEGMLNYGTSQKWHITRLLNGTQEHCVETRKHTQHINKRERKTTQL